MGPEQTGLRFSPGAALLKRRFRRDKRLMAGKGNVGDTSFRRSAAICSGLFGRSTKRKINSRILLLCIQVLYMDLRPHYVVHVGGS